MCVLCLLCSSALLASFFDLRVAICCMSRDLHLHTLRFASSLDRKIEVLVRVVDRDRRFAVRAPLLVAAAHTRPTAGAVRALAIATEEVMGTADRLPAADHLPVDALPLVEDRLPCAADRPRGAGPCLHREDAEYLTGLQRKNVII
jgi:hypothetical protein